MRCTRIPNYMATYHQYSEIVAAYGYRLPPPPPPQASRVGLALLYAAVGVALGTFTGTSLAVATLPPEASLLPHLTFARSISPDFKIHPIANAPGAPVILNHAVTPLATVTPAPVAQPASGDHAATAHLNAAPALFIHQEPAIQKPATTSMASAAPAPAASRLATVLAASPVQAPVILSHPVIQAADAGKPQILNLAPIVHPAPVVHAQAIKPAPTAAANVQIAVAAPAPAPPLVQKQVSIENTIAAAAPVASPLATPAQPQPPAAPSAAAMPPASLSAGLDGTFKPLVFYSEGDATVVGYDAPSDTITTDDGRTFVIGTTVSSSSAVSWQDYRSNVHYRCDQNNNCSLVRTGVIALNAKLL